MPHKFGTQYFFRSDLFEIEAGEDAETNPLCFGRQLAHWLRGKLFEKGYSDEVVIPEDWGWCVMCAREPFLLWVGCVSVHDYTKAQPTDPLPKGREVTWSCLPAAETSWLRGLFGRVDPTHALERLTRDLHAVLSAEPRIALTEEH